MHNITTLNDTVQALLLQPRNCMISGLPLPIDEDPTAGVPYWVKEVVGEDTKRRLEDVCVKLVAVDGDIVAINYDFIAILLAHLDPSLHTYLEKTISQFPHIYPAGCMRLFNCGGPGDSNVGWYSSRRRVSLDSTLLWDALGIRGAAAADADSAWSRIEAALASPPVCFKHTLKPADEVTIDDVLAAVAVEDQRLRRWWNMFFADDAWVELFKDWDEWYDLVGVWDETTQDWHCLPVPIFVMAWPSTTSRVLEMPWGPRQELLETIPTIVSSTRERLDDHRDARARRLEKYVPHADGRGLARLEEDRAGLGCAVLISDAEINRIVRLPWRQQPPAYMAAIRDAYNKYVSTTDDDAIYPNLPSVGDGPLR